MPGSSEHARRAGDFDTAQALFERAIAIKLPLLEQEPESPAYLRSLSFDYERMAAIAEAQLDAGTDLQWSLKMYHLKERLQTLSPEIPTYRLEYAIACMRMARLELAVGQRDEARQHLERARGILEALCAADPQNEFYQQNLQMCLTALAGFAD